MAHATIITAITADNNEHVLLCSETVASLRRNIADALRHPAFETAEQIDGPIEFPVEVLRDAKIEREIGFVNDVETSGQAIFHIVGAQKELTELLATGAVLRLFVSVE